MDRRRNGNGALLQVDELLKRGFAALEEGRPREAAEFCRKAIAADPLKVEAHFLVGLVALDMNDLKTATRGFGSVTKLDPGHAAAFAQLARIFMRMGQPARAERALMEAKRAGVNEAPVADLVGVVSSLLGDQREAEKWYRLACEKAPESAAFAVNLATALIFLGEIVEAKEVLERILSRDATVAHAQWLYSSLVKADSPDRARKLAARAATADRYSAAFLYYAAGKEFEDCSAWDEAFAAFDAGARAKRSLVDYDEAAEAATFDTLMATFTPQWAAQEREGSKDPSPIFVVGQPRTGTTLIERIISSHSLVESAGELQQFGLSARRLTPDAEPARFSAANVRKWASLDFKALGEEYLRVTKPMRAGAPRFVDKLPNNYLHIPLIIAALPNAKIVHLTRDPMDACFASFKQLFADAYFHSYDQEELARHYIRYAMLMEHWRRIFPGRFLDISYEATVANLEPQARRLIAYLGLSWEDACLAFHEREGAVATASAVQVREKAHTRSIGRWRRYERSLSPLRNALSAAGVVL
ncbi:MAG: sulfotransferase [Parvularculaceae bacterium]|nr:sulfotransferase [Parvularculaceae bacterium]